MAQQSGQPAAGEVTDCNLPLPPPNGDQIGAVPVQMAQLFDGDDLFELTGGSSADWFETWKVPHDWVVDDDFSHATAPTTADIGRLVQDLPVVTDMLEVVQAAPLIDAYDGSAAAAAAELFGAGVGVVNEAHLNYISRVLSKCQ